MQRTPAENAVDWALCVRSKPAELTRNYTAPLLPFGEYRASYGNAQERSYVELSAKDWAAAASGLLERDVPNSGIPQLYNEYGEPLYEPPVVVAAVDGRLRAAYRPLPPVGGLGTLWYFGRSPPAERPLLPEESAAFFERSPDVPQAWRSNPRGVLLAENENVWIRNDVPPPSAK